MSRERESVSAQLTLAEQVKLVAEGELAEVRPDCNSAHIIACQQNRYVVKSWPCQTQQLVKNHCQKDEKGFNMW